MVQRFLAHGAILEACTHQCTCFPPRHWGSRRLWVWLKLFRSLAQGNSSYWNKILWRKAKQSNSPSLWTLQSSVDLHVTPKRDPVQTSILNQVLGRLLLLTENTWLCASGTRQKDCCQSCPLKRRLTLPQSWFLHTPAIWCAILEHSQFGRKNAIKHEFHQQFLKDRAGCGGKAAPGPCREIVANAGNSCCGPFGSGLLWFCRNQSWFPSYLSRSGFYQLHSSHHCFLPQRQSCLCLVQRATPSPALAAPCVGTDPRSSCHLQQAVLAGFLALHLQPAVVISFFTSPLRWERFGRRILWDTAEPQVQLCHGREQAHCSSQQNWAGGLRLPQSFISSGFLCLRR